MRSGRAVQGWRKLAGASWPAPCDPQFYGDLEIDAATLLSYIGDLRRRSGQHVTVTHAVVKAVAHGLRAVPELNVRLVRGRSHPRESVDVLVIVALGDDDLTGIKVCDVDRKSLVDIARELEERVARIRSGEDAEFGRTKTLLNRLPPRLLRLGLRVSAWLTSDLNVNLPALGLPRQAFGAAMVSSIGGTGIAHAYSPLAAYYRVPVLVLVGAIQEKPVVVAGSVVARPILTLTATADHRYLDGVRAARFANAARSYLLAPATFEPPVADPRVVTIPTARAGNERAPVDTANV
jgi:hypothetical protein